MLKYNYEEIRLEQTYSTFIRHIFSIKSLFMINFEMVFALNIEQDAYDSRLIDQIWHVK